MSESPKRKFTFTLCLIAAQKEPLHSLIDKDMYCAIIKSIFDKMLRKLLCILFVCFITTAL